MYAFRHKYWTWKPQFYSTPNFSSVMIFNLYIRLRG